MTAETELELGRDMDWQKLSNAVSKAQTLGPEDLETYLGGLSEKSPDMSDEVRRMIQNARQADAFMMTAVGDYLPEAEPLYKAGDVVGQWRVETLLGSGGMGDVYKAQRVDNLYDHVVALKVMRGDSQQRKDRFKAERQRLATLNHPGISAIIDGGVSEAGYPFMAMDFIDGITISDFVRDKNPSESKILKLFRDVCASVSHAHNNLILHRDLKAENILVTGDGAVKLIDFGISSLLSDDDAETHMSYSLATAAPEQLGDGPVSVQTDIFALGAILYQLLTGELPARQPDGSVKTKSDKLSKDLKAILEKCLQTEPTQRYDSVTALRSDITSYQEVRPVAARQGGRLYTFGRLLKRAPLASGLAAGFIAALGGGLVVSQHFAQAAQSEADRANAELARAEWALDNAKTQTDVSIKYADALQRLFGDEADSERMNAILLEHWTDITTNPESSDEAKANISFAMGRHFAARLDFKQAQSILEPWLEAGYGNHELRREAKALLAETYLQVGQGKKAAQYVVEVAEMYKGTFAENSPAHVKDMMKASYYSHDRNIMKETKNVAMQTLNTDIDLQEKSRIWNQMIQINLLTKDFDGAHDAAANVVEIGNSIPDYPITNLITDIDNLCQMKFFVKRNFEDAKNCMAELQSNEFKEIGDNNTGVNIYGVQALSEREAGNLTGANNLIDEALKYDIDPAKHHVAALAEAEVYAAMIKSDLSQWDEVEALIKRSESKMGGHNNQNISLMKAYLMTKRDGVEAAKQFLQDTKFSQRRARYFFRLTYVMDELQALGLDWESL